jgi:LmbE family N-acetylglucosaminyl deacetylase
MKKKSIYILLFAAISFIPVFAEPLPPAEKTAPCDQNVIERFSKDDRILIMAPHPDDEAIGCAGVIQQAVAAGAQVKVAYLTNGEHNEFAFIVYEKRILFRQGAFIYMGEVRQKEAERAMQSLGVEKKNLIFLGYPDYGTFKVFCQHWQDAKPYRSIMTRISAVPYKEHLSYGAPYVGESILKDVESVLLAYKPTRIFVSHPADVNGDHKAFYLFLEVALADLKQDIPEPKVHPYLIHCVDWPIPRWYHPELYLEPPQKFQNSPINWVRLDLTDEQLFKKHEAILAYRSQTESGAFYLLSFGRKNELFGDYSPLKLKRQQLSDEGHPFSLLRTADKPIDFRPEQPAAPPESAGFVPYVNYAVVGDDFLIRVNKKKEVNRRYGMIIYLFGYKYKTPFAQMPKIFINTKYKNFQIYDKDKMIDPQGSVLEMRDREVILKIPLKLLGSPDFILASLKARAELLPADAASFQKIIIGED